MLIFLSSDGNLKYLRAAGRHEGPQRDDGQAVEKPVSPDLCVTKVEGASATSFS